MSNSLRTRRPPASLLCPTYYRRYICTCQRLAYSVCPSSMLRPCIRVGHFHLFSYCCVQGSILVSFQSHEKYSRLTNQRKAYFRLVVLEVSGQDRWPCCFEQVLHRVGDTHDVHSQWRRETSANMLSHLRTLSLCLYS